MLMNNFPLVDPIPLPAPVWLFKVLHILTLALHFISVELLLGGMLVALWLNFRGNSSPLSELGRIRLSASSSISRRLPIVMTYVINLGVPPLLFAQVLYGRAIYTSSVLIGLYWISVVFLLMACYWILYKFAARSEQGKMAWHLGLFAWLLAIAIAKIYSTNMTLMLRPEVWSEMYSKSAFGLHLPPSDPTLIPRWLFMITGGLTITGLWMIWLSGRKNISDKVRIYLGKNGGWLAVAGIAIQAVLVMKVLGNQPDAVKTALPNNTLFSIAKFVWIGSAALIALVGIAGFMTKHPGSALPWSALLTGFLLMSGMAVCRDAIRDVTLASKGFDVWNRVVVTNWVVVGAFIVLFVGGLIVLGWLISVVVKAKPISEEVAYE